MPQPSLNETLTYPNSHHHRGPPAYYDERGGGGARGGGAYDAAPRGRY